MKRVTRFKDHHERKIADFQQPNGDWKEVEDWPHQTLVQVCENKDCSAYGVEHRMDVPVNVDGAIRPLCGPCKQAPAVYDPDE